MEAVTVAAGGEAVLVVSLENIQVAKISWQKGGREVVPGPHFTTTETQKSAQLIIHGAAANDSGTYTALVTKPDGSQARAAVALQVASLSAPCKIEAPTFVRSLSDLAAKVGTRVRFLVELRQAHDVKVYWYHNNLEVVEDPRFRILHEGSFFCVDISPLTVDDEGPWRCLAENSYGQASSAASLRVIVPKGYKKPVFLEELEAILTAEGTVSLECKVVGVPTPILKWFKDGNEIKAGDVFALTANPEDPTSLGTYTCEAVNCMGRALSSSRVRVVSRESSLRPPSRMSRRSPTPIGPPPVLVEELVDRRVKVGEKGRLTVKVEIPPEIISVTWYNNGKKIEASEKYRLSDEGGGKYMIEVAPAEIGDDGEWKVVVRNEGGYTSSTCKITLTVPRNYRCPRFLDDLRAVLTEEGLVSFECKVVGYPTPFLQWFKDGQELKPGDVYQLSGTNSLGKYSCVAKNCMGESQSSAELTLEDIKSHLNEEEKEQLLATNIPPRFIQGLKSRDIKIGDPVRLTVQVTMTPTPEVVWYHEDEVMCESTKCHLSKADPGYFHLDLSSLEIQDQGEWKCVASNDFGHSVTAASLKLVIPRHYKKPVFLEPLRAVLSQEGTVNLECKVIGVPQPVLKWYKDGTELKPGDIHRIISGEDGTCCLGTYTCEAINIMGSASSSAALLGFEDKLLQKEGDKITAAMALADARGIARNPSLSTINEERSSQISVYESAISEAEGEKADVSVSIDGKEVSLSLYETPDISEAEAKQIAEIYAEEISDHLSAHDSNQAELPPLRFVRETSRKGPLIMEAMVIDVEDQAFDEYISMADFPFDDARTEADVEELSAMEAVVVDDREVLCSDIADLPEMEVWGEEHVSAHTVSMEAKGVAHISEQDIMQPDLRTLSEQGLSFLQTHARELQVAGKEAAIAEEAQVMSAGPKTLISEKAHRTVAEAQAVPGLSVAQAQEQAVFTSLEKMKSERAERAQVKRSVEAGEVALAEQQQFLSGADTLSDVTNISKVLERYPSFIPHEAVEVGAHEALEQIQSLKSEERPSKKVKRASEKKSQIIGKAAMTHSPDVYEGEATPFTDEGIRAERARAVASEFEEYKVMSTEVLEDVASLEAQGKVAQHARVKDASQREALMMEQADVISGSAKSMKLKQTTGQKATQGQISAAGLAQQQEQSFYTATQDIPESFPAEETEADFSELHSMLEPMQSSEPSLYEQAEIFEGYTPEQQMAMQLDPSYREALAVSIKEGYSQASDLTLVSGHQSQAYAHQTLHEAVEGYEQMGISADVREMAEYAQGVSDKANFLTGTTNEALMVQEADVDYANLNVFNREDMSHMLTTAEERSGSLAECIVVQEADLQSEAAIVSQRPAVQPERAVAGIVEGAAESATVGEPPLVAGMAAGKAVEASDKKRSASETAKEDEKIVASGEGKSVIISLVSDEVTLKKMKLEESKDDEGKPSTTLVMTPEEIQAKKEELKSKLQNLRARKEAGLLIRTPSSESLTESLEGEEAKIIKEIDMTEEASKRIDEKDKTVEVISKESGVGKTEKASKLKRSVSKEKATSPKRGKSQEKSPSGDDLSHGTSDSGESTGASLKRRLSEKFASLKRGPSADKISSEDGVTSPKRGSSQEKSGLLKRGPSFEKSLSPKRGLSQEKSISPPESPTSLKDGSEKEDLSQEKDSSEGKKKKGLFAGMKSAISSKVSEMKTVITTGKSTAKAEEVEVMEDSTEDLKAQEKAQIVSVDVSQEKDSDIVSKDQVKTTEIATVIALVSPETIVNGQKTVTGDSLTISQESTMPLIEAQEALKEQQVKETVETDGAKQGVLVLDSLAAKKEEILARKQELLAKQEAAMKSRGESEEPSSPSDLTSTSEISTGSGSEMESVMEFKETKKTSVIGSAAETVSMDMSTGTENKKLVATTEVYEESTVSADANLSLKKKDKPYEKDETSAGLSLKMKAEEAESKQLTDIEISKKEVELKVKKESIVMKAEVTDDTVISETVEDLKVKSGTAVKVIEEMTTVAGSNLSGTFVTENDAIITRDESKSKKAKSPEMDKQKRSSLKGDEEKDVDRKAKKSMSPEAKDADSKITGFAKAKTPEKARKRSSLKEEDVMSTVRAAEDAKVGITEAKDADSKITGFAKAKTPEKARKRSSLKEEDVMSTVRVAEDAKVSITEKDDSKKAKSPELKTGIEGKEEAKMAKTSEPKVGLADKEESKKAKSPEAKVGIEDIKDSKMDTSLEDKTTTQSHEETKKAKSPEPKFGIKSKEDSKLAEAKDKEDSKKAKSPEPKAEIKDKEDSKKAKSPEPKAEIKDKEDSKKAKSPESKAEIKDREDSKKAKSPEPKAGIKDKDDSKRAKSPETKAEVKGKEDSKKAKSPELKAAVSDKDGSEKARSPEPKATTAKKDIEKSKSPESKAGIELIEDSKKAKSPEPKVGKEACKRAESTESDTKIEQAETIKESEYVSKKDSEISTGKEADVKGMKVAETISVNDSKKAKSPEAEAKQDIEKKAKKEDKDAAEKAKSPDISERKRSSLKEDVKDTTKEIEEESQFTEKARKSKSPGPKERRRSSTKERDVESITKYDDEMEFKEKARKSKSPGPKLRKKSSIKESDVKAADGVDSASREEEKKAKSPGPRLRKRSSTKEEDVEASSRADKAKSPETPTRKRSSVKRDKRKSRSPETLEGKRSSLKDDERGAPDQGIEESVAFRGAELRQQEELLRDKKVDDRRTSQEKMIIKDEDDLLKLQEEERAKRQSEMRKEEIERLNREEKEIAERRRKRKEEEDKRRIEELDKLKIEEQEKAEKRKKEWEEKEKKRREEQEEEEKEEMERKKKLEIKREEIERLKKEEDVKLQKEEAERNERRKQRKLEEEKAMKEQEEKSLKQEKERREKRRKMKQEEEKLIKEKEEERRKLEEMEQEERKKKKIQVKEEEEKHLKEEEERRKERRKRREEQAKLVAEEDAKLEEERRKRVEKEKKLLEEELRGREEAKRRKEEDLKLQGEEFLKKEEERRRKRMEDRKRRDEEEEKEYRKMVQESEDKRREERAKREIAYSEKELVTLERYGSLSRLSRPTTPDQLEGSRRRDPRRRPKFSTKLQDRQIVKGTRVRLSCNVISSLEDDSPEIEWFKGGYPIKVDERLKIANYEGVASLELSHTCKADSGEYTCTAKNRHGRVSTTCDLRVKGDEDQRPTPPTFTTSLRERYVSEDDELVLSCHVMGFPQPKITWLKDADKLPASPRFQTTITEEGICKLLITSPRMADSGTYTCHAENRVYRDEISANIQVQVLIDKERKNEGVSDDSEVPRFVSELCDQYVQENGTLTLQVEVAGSPAPEVLWLFNGRSLHASGKFRISATGNTHTLTVFQVTQKDIGTYSCRITNRYGHAYTMSSVYFGSPKPRRGVSVPGADMEMRAPTFKERPESMVTVYKDEEIHLSCAVVGEPTPRVTWQKGAHDVSNTTRATKTVRDNHHSLVIRGATFTDSGTYTVEAKNTHGTVRAYCSVKVRETYRSRSFSPRGQDEVFPTTGYDEIRRTTGRFIRDVPGKVGTPIAHDVGKNWVSLQWTRPEHTGGVMVTAYKVESWILGEEARWQDLGVSPIPSFDIYHLKQDREYLFRVTPRNKYGWGEAVMTPRPIRIGRKIEHPNFPRCLPHQVRAMPGGCISLDAQVTGEPMPEIRWYKDGTVIDLEKYPRFNSICSEGSMHHIFGFLCKVSLRIQDLQWNDEGKYELEVLNPGGRVTSYTRVSTTNDCSILEAQEKINNNLMALSRLDTVPAMAPQFTMRLRDRRVQVGFPVRLTCQIVGVPKPDVNWFKDGDKLNVDDCHTTWQEDGHFYTLEISNSTHDDAAVYSACASNPYGSVLCKCRLIVDSGLRSYISPMFLRELEDQSVREGETLTLQTVIEAYPTIGVVWHRDGQRIRPSRKHSFSLDADGIASLVIRRADYTDGGLYTCTATNEMGHIESICRVSVSCTDSDLASGKRKVSKIWYNNEPMFVRKPRAIDAEEGDLVIIECEVSGDPKPTVSWLRDWIEPSVYTDGDRFQEIGTGPIYRLEIPNCRIEDTGAYSILAKNDHGETRAVVSVQVYTKGLKGELEGRPIKRGVMEYVPVVTRPLQDVRCCDGDSVTLEALVEAPKHSIIRWEKQGKVLKLGGDIESEWDGSQVRLKIREVYPEDEGEYSCIIFNDMGKTVTSATLIVEMADDKENDVTVQMEHRPDLSRRTTPSRTNTPSRFSRSPSANFQREGSAHSWAGVGWREPSVSVPHWRPLSRGSSPLLLARRFTPEPSARSKSRRSHGPKFYYIPHDRIVEEGETVTFQCAVKGNPVPRSSWDKDSMKIVEGGRIKMEERDEVRMLEIPKVTQQDAGLYRVTIENEMGREQATARLDVIKASGNKYAGYVRSWNTSPLTAPQFARRMHSTSVSEGNRLTLRTEFRGSPIPRAKWYKNNELLPLCDDFPQTYNGRHAILEIGEVTSADAGTYTCVLINDAGKTECSCEVIVEHRNEIPNTPPYFIQGLKDFTVLDGDDVRLTVRVGGSMPMKVVWVRNDLEIKPSKLFRYEEEGDGWFSLYMTDIYPHDTGIYICEAYNMHGETHTYCKMAVHDPRVAKSSAPRIVGNLTPLVVEEGSAARFSVAVHGQPTPTLTWFCDGRKLGSTPRIKVKVDEDVGPDGGHQHTLGIIHSLSTDSGVISVVASNCLGTDTASTTLKVNLYAPQRENRYRSTISSSSIVDANSVGNAESRLTPPRTSNSPAPRIKPMLKEITNIGSGSVDSAYGSSSLRDSSGCSSSLSNVSELEYDSATKEHLQIEMSQKHLQMVESHKEEEEEEEVEEDFDADEELEMGCEADSDEVGAEIVMGPMDVTVLKGQSATLTATYTGKPEPLVSWYKKEQEITDGGRCSVKTENGITTLIIHDIVQEDCDKYTVTVRNTLGAHAAFASLAVGSAPEPPADRPNHSEVTADSVTLSWYGPTYDGGSAITGYIVEANKIGNGDWFTLISGSHSTSYIAQGLDTNCQYEFRVRAQNIHGVSEPSKASIPVTTAAPADREDEPEVEDHETAFAPLNVEIESGSNFDQKYKMHEEVGKGRFGIVYRVTFKETGTRRAAKVIKCIKAKEKEKVREEISIMNALRHPKLLQLGAAYERQREIIMVMEYISGGELFERVVADDFALTERDCILFVRQICEGVQYMHKSHIVHLDLKPENILCVRRTSHQIKLIDFGLARRFNPNDQLRVLFGTPEFIAPEIINYELISFSSDMWSVGVICYVLLSGLSPFMGDNDAETFANITCAEFDFDDDAFTAITEDAKDFIRSLLIKRKEKRLTAEDCFNHPWLAQTEEDMNKVVLSTDKLKKFIIRRKWQDRIFSKVERHLL